MSLAAAATLIGLRANATTISDRSVMVLVARAVRVSAVNGSCLVSETLKPSKPSASAARAASSEASRDSATPAPVSISICPVSRTQARQARKADENRAGDARARADRGQAAAPADCCCGRGYTIAVLWSAQY